LVGTTATVMQRKCKATSYQDTQQLLLSDGEWHA